jgi:pimeloyl-ACP methyl ester carboxylesterase
MGPGPAPGGPARPRTGGGYDPPVPDPSRLHTGEVDLAYLEAGPVDGPLALCVHGFPDHAPTWSGLLGPLAEAGYHAVAPWLRGYSPSGLAPDGNYQVGALAADVLAVVDALGGERPVVLIGHDWGAAAVYAAAAHRPERVRRLVTMAVPHMGGLMGAFLSSPEQLRRSFYIFLFQTPLAETVVPLNDFAFIDFLWRTWSPGLVPEAGFMRALKDTLAAPGSTEAAIAYYRHMLGGRPGRPDYDAIQAAGAGPIPVPTLYLHGTDDGCMGVELVDEAGLRGFFPAGLEVDLVPAAGHFLHLDQPERVTRRVLEFLGPA